jgi:hypothetical protein
VGIDVPVRLIFRGTCHNANGIRRCSTLSMSKLYGDRQMNHLALNIPTTLYDLATLEIQTSCDDHTPSDSDEDVSIE